VAARPAGRAGTPAPQDMKKAMQALMPPRQINEAILISLRNNFVFTRVSKVANSSLKHLVYSMEKPAWSRPIRDNLIHDSLYGPVIRPDMLGLASPILHEALFSDSFYRFTFVRNPYAKVLSAYLDRYMAKDSSLRRLVNTSAVRNGWMSSADEDVSFSMFLRAIAETNPRHMEVHISPQYVQTMIDLVTYSYVGAFETLAEDTRHVAKRLWGKDDAALGFKSPSRTDATSRLLEIYTDADIALVNRVYERDFETFGYRMADRVADFADDSMAVRQPQTAV
jgi:hypothetical protein